MLIMLVLYMYIELRVEGFFLNCVGVLTMVEATLNYIVPVLFLMTYSCNTHEQLSLHTVSNFAHGLLHS